LSKEFENIDENYKSKILETINRIIEKSGDHHKIQIHLEVWESR
jgi:hypothetical protein